MTDNTTFDLEAFRALASARSEPRDISAAQRVQYKVNILAVHIHANHATLHLQETGKMRGIDMFVDLTTKGMINLLEAINHKCLSLLKEEMKSHMWAEDNRLNGIKKESEIIEKLFSLELEKKISHETRMILMNSLDFSISENDEKEREAEIISEIERKIYEE